MNTHAMGDADIAVIGLAVMGQNLILNMDDHGFKVVAYNRTVEKVEKFLANEAKGMYQMTPSLTLPQLMRGENETIHPPSQRQSAPAAECAKKRRKKKQRAHL